MLHNARVATPGGIDVLAVPGYPLRPDTVLQFEGHPQATCAVTTVPTGLYIVVVSTYAARHVVLSTRAIYDPVVPERPCWCRRQDGRCEPGDDSSCSQSAGHRAEVQYGEPARWCCGLHGIHERISFTWRTGGLVLVGKLHAVLLEQVHVRRRRVSSQILSARMSPWGQPLDVPAARQRRLLLCRGLGRPNRVGTWSSLSRSAPTTRPSPVRQVDDGIGALRTALPVCVAVNGWSDTASNRGPRCAESTIGCRRRPCRWVRAGRATCRWSTGLTSGVAARREVNG